MKVLSKGLLFAVATLTTAWLTSIAFATGGPVVAVQARGNSIDNGIDNGIAPGTAIPRHLAVTFRAAAGQAQAAGTPKPQMSEAVFKNIQVLKGIPVDEFMGTMGVFTTSLSLCCGNCHTGAGTSNPKWEDDPPRKRTARAMVSMVQNINKTSFGGRQVVTCWTCHRGQLA